MATTWFLLIKDRGPFFNVEHDKVPPLADVRDCYLCRQHGETGHEGVLWAIEKPIHAVAELYRWAVSLGITVRYDYGTTDEKHRRPTGIPELDGVPLPVKANRNKAGGGGIFD